MSQTVRRQIAGSGPLATQPITVSGVAGTKTAFGLGTIGGAPVTITGAATVVPLAAGNTGLYAGTGKVLHVRAEGTLTGISVTTTPATNAVTLALTLYQVTGAAIQAGGLTQTAFPSGYNSVAAPSAATLSVGAASASFQLDAFLQLDASGNLTGFYTLSVNGAAITSQTIISTVTGLAGEADLNFVLAETLNATNGDTPNAVLTLDLFSIGIDD
jgi:hypothetical protein